MVLKVGLGPNSDLCRECELVNAGRMSWVRVKAKSETVGEKAVTSPGRWPGDRVAVERQRPSLRGAALQSLGLSSISRSTSTLLVSL